MSDQLINVSRLESLLQSFAEERNWQQFHTPKNLIMALTGEVGELAEIFQWLSDDETKVILQNPKKAQAVQDELADVMLYLVRLSNVLGVDLNSAVIHKLKTNAEKYPPEKVFGSNAKYTEI